VTYAIGVFRSVEAIISFYHCDRFYSSYKPFKVFFDRFGRHDNREELVFKAAVFGYVANWSATVPMACAPVLGDTHPFSRLYAEVRSGRVAIDLRKLLSDNFHFADSKTVWQIRLADFLANTWLRVVSDHDPQ
jgi:hypothetical protein